MSFRRFRDYVARVLETLPAELKQHLDNVVVDVEDEPDEQTLRGLDFTEEEIADGASLYGLFVPFPIDTEALDVNDRPNRIIIYKNPLEEDFPDRRQLLIEIRKTVVHELSHHFGYSDRDLERFDSTDNPFPDELLADEGT
jgi:predicted Zn-dependent protease with MMP-like domain